MRTAGAMVRHGKQKIGRRIVLLVLVSVTLSIVTLTGSFLWLQLRDSIEARRAGIQATGYVFASAIADHVAAGNQQAVFNALRSIRRVPDVRSVIAIDAEGREIASLGQAAMLESDIVDASAGWFAVLTRGWFPVETAIVKAGRPAGRRSSSPTSARYARRWCRRRSSRSSSRWRQAGSGSPPRCAYSGGSPVPSPR